MLTFRFLNVDHGASVLIEFEHAGSRFFGLIDSNCNFGSVPKALSYLRNLNANGLSFLALTHPHNDHFSGLYTIMVEFRGKIKEFYSFPLGNFIENAPRRAKLKKQLSSLFARTDSESLRHARLELLQILRWAQENHNAGLTIWQECDGELNTLAPEGFAGVEFSTILPPKSAKAHWLEKIDKGELDRPGAVNENDLSIALSLKYCGIEVIVGGDGTKVNWESKRRFEIRRGAAFGAPIVNLPHHGSRLDCDSDVLEFLFCKNGDRFGISSADGNSHPAPETINWLSDHGIAPYCTNLISLCGANVMNLPVSPGLNRELARWIQEVSNKAHRIQVCQGDITLTISDRGAVTIGTETGVPCGFRGEYSKILNPKGA